MSERRRLLFPAQVGVGKESRAVQKGQRACVLWLTGLSAAGKSTIAARLECRLHALGRHAYVLDGDNLRSGINGDLGFSAAERAENVRRVAEIARLMVDAGLIVIAALISPCRADRARARSLFERAEFIEVHVHASLALAESRDPKGLYRRARMGQLSGFTGIDAPYEAPDAPEITVDTATLDADAAAARIVAWLRERAYLLPR